VDTPFPIHGEANWNAHFNLNLADLGACLNDHHDASFASNRAGFVADKSRRGATLTVLTAASRAPEDPAS
jgi:hypothetical protein